MASGRAAWSALRVRTRSRATWIDRLGIRCAGPRQPVSALSGGNQQKVALARLLYHDVDVLIPRRAHTRDRRGEQGADLRADRPRRVAPVGERAKAVLLVSSYLPELLGMCDRIAVMSRGRLGAPRPAAEWTEHALLMAASGALAS